MPTRFGVVFVVIILLSFIFILYSNKVNAELIKDVQEMVKNFIYSSLIKDVVQNINSSIIIGLCIVATVIFIIVFKGIFFFMIIFGILIMMFFGGIEKATDYLKEKFKLIKDIELQSNNKKKVVIK